MRQVRAELPFAPVPAMVWQFTQAFVSNTFRPAATCSNCTAGCSVAGPSAETLQECPQSPQQHLGVLCAAILRALADKDSCLVRVDPHFILAIRNQVGLARQLRNPETVVGIGRKQNDVRGVASVVSLTGTCNSLAVINP